MNLLYANDTRGEHAQSYYLATANDMPQHAVLRGQKKADVCVIGGGFTGLSSALHLAEKGLSVILLEAHRVGWGASGRNGGQVGSGQRNDQDELEAKLGKTHARHLWDIAEEAKAIVAERITKHAIKCDHRPGVAHAELQSKAVSQGHAYAEKLARDYAYDKIETLDKDAMQALVGSLAYQGGTLDRGASHLHPLNFALGLAKAAHAQKVQIFEKTEVHHINQGPVVTVQSALGRVEADFVILACNGYLGGLDRHVACKVMPVNNFIVATKPLGKAMAESLIARDVAVADSKFVVNYFRRSSDNRMIFGGGENYTYRFPKDIRTLVRKPMLAIFPQLADVPLDYAWGGTLGITMNRMPDFQRLAPNIYSAAGYSGHGVAMATMAGKILANAIAGQAGQFDVMAKIPMKSFPGGASLRWPGLVLAMTWYAMRDRLGF